jgi:hypothetical protein
MESIADVTGWWQKADLWASLILGAIIAIPISVLANMLTPHASTFIFSYSRKRRLRSIEAINGELERIQAFVEHKDSLNLYFMRCFILITILTSIPQLATALFVPLLLTRSSLFLEWFSVGSQLVNAFFVMLALNVAVRALSVYRKVVQFDSFKKQAMDRIQRLSI